jgi:hypothetical protein
MYIEVKPPRVIYTAETNDWRLSIGDGLFVIEPIATGGLVYSSGVNLDNLAALIVAAKEDAIGLRGTNWEGD